MYLFRWKFETAAGRTPTCHRERPKGREAIPKAPVETAPLASKRPSPFRLLAVTHLRRISPWSVFYGISTDSHTLPGATGT